MNLDSFKQAVKETVPFFYWRDRYDEKYLIKSMLEIIENRQEYEAFSEQFQYLPAEFVFFIKLSFGELEGRTKEVLKQAEKKYKLEMSSDKISRDLLLEAVSKSCIIALVTKTSFKTVFSQEILEKTVNRKILLTKKGTKTTLNVVLHSILNEDRLASRGVYPENLFIRQVTS